MVGSGRERVKHEGTRAIDRLSTADCGHWQGHADLPSDHPTRTPLSTILLVLVGLAAAVAAAVAFVRSRRPTRHQRALRQVLDAADALEDRLRVARAEIEAVVGERERDPVGDALREMLRQRLWLRDHGANASVEQLDRVRETIDEARGRIEDQLDQIERARAPLT